MTDPDNERDFERKSFLEHIEDLRWVIVKCAFALTVEVLLCFLYTRPLMSVLLWPLRDIGVDPSRFLRVLGVVDPFTIQIQISLAGGVILALPIILYCIGQFLLPALTPKEKRLLLPVFSAGVFLFISGIVFCYFLLLPKTLQFFLDYNTWLGVASEWTLLNYLDFIVQMLLAFGIAFELPLVILTLNWFGIVSYQMLVSGRRYAFIIIMVFAACIIPTPDLFSLMLLTLPMYFLYEVCIWITWFRKRQDTVIIESP